MLEIRLEPTKIRSLIKKISLITNTKKYSFKNVKNQSIKKEFQI